MSFLLQCFQIETSSAREPEQERGKGLTLGAVKPENKRHSQFGRKTGMASWSVQLDKELLSQPAEASKQLIRLISADGETFVVEKRSVIMSNLIAFKILSQPNAEAYPLMNVSGRILSLVLEFCTTHTATRDMHGGGQDKGAQNPAFLEIEKPMTKGTDLSMYVSRWDFTYIRKAERDPKLLRLLFYAANYLDVKPLFELIAASVACKYVASALQQPNKQADLKFNESFNLRTSTCLSPTDLQVGEEFMNLDSSERDKEPQEEEFGDGFSFAETEWYRAENSWLVEVDQPVVDDDLHVDLLDSRLKMSYVCGTLFREFDRDGSSTLDASELQSMLNVACSRAAKVYDSGAFSLSDAEDVIDVFDTDGDKLVSLHEFLSWVENLSPDAIDHYVVSEFEIEKKLGTFFAALERLADNLHDERPDDHNI